MVTRGLIHGHTHPVCSCFRSFCVFTLLFTFCSCFRYRSRCFHSCCLPSRQGHFNATVFTLEQQEYEAEGVPWDRVGHTSNEDTLSLLEGRMGVLMLLQEQCRLQNGDDTVFCEAVRMTHSAHVSFVAPRLPKTSFAIRHYAGLVTYQVRIWQW